MGNVYATVAQFRVTSVLAKALINVPDAVIQQALNAKAGTIDGYLQNQFVLPVIPFPSNIDPNPWPYDIMQLNIDLATPLVLQLRGLNPSGQDQEVLNQRAEETRFTIKGLMARTYRPVFYADSSANQTVASPQAYPMPSSWDVLNPRCRW